MQWIYRRAMEGRRAKNLKRRSTQKAPCPIVSVGNLTTGGTGKTPAVQWLTQGLQSHNRRVGIASRGYGGSASDNGALVSDGKSILLKPAEAGDEAFLHARNLPGAIVAVAKDRHHAVELCLQAGAEVVVLDDAFQFWSLPRHFELVLLDARRPFGNGHLLPRGRLREEPEALGRANAILLTRCDRATPEELNHSQQLVREFTTAPVFTSTHRPRGLRDEKTGESISLDYLKRRTVKAFAGLADNSQFYDALNSLGASHLVKLKRERGDHHAWKQNDFQWFDSAAPINQHQTELFENLPVVTTEKDAVKLDPQWFGGPLYSLRIAMDIEDERALLRLILNSLR
ncbi:tetraacyldisaccharide 4'-kinase [bacterium]|nr:MAG: tetraacyldisaccharide 4'-kinase [bacterium]